MRTLKILSLAAVAAMALMAFAASSASATALYNGTTKLGVGSTVDFSIASGTSLVVTDLEGEELDRCSGSTFKSSISNAGGASATTSLNLGSLTFVVCTFPTATVTLSGSPEIHQIGTTTNGTVTANGDISVTINIPLFGTCVYALGGGIDIGTTTTASSGASTFHWNLRAFKRSGSSLTCPETTIWTGTYTGTEPANLRVESS